MDAACRAFGRAGRVLAPTPGRDAGGNPLGHQRLRGTNRHRSPLSPQGHLCGRQGHPAGPARPFASLHLAGRQEEGQRPTQPSHTIAALSSARLWSRPMARGRVPLLRGCRRPVAPLRWVLSIMNSFRHPTPAGRESAKILANTAHARPAHEPVVNSGHFGGPYTAGAVAFHCKTVLLNVDLSRSKHARPGSSYTASLPLDFGHSKKKRPTVPSARRSKNQKGPPLFHQWGAPPPLLETRVAENHGRASPECLKRILWCSNLTLDVTVPPGRVFQTGGARSVACLPESSAQTFQTRPRRVGQERPPKPSGIPVSEKASSALRPRRGSHMDDDRACPGLCDGHGAGSSTTGG